MALVVNSYLFHIGKAEIIVNFLNNRLTTIKTTTFEQCLRLIQFSGTSCSIGLFMSCNPKQKLYAEYFPSTQIKTEKKRKDRTRVSWPILAYMLFFFLLLSVPVNNFSVMSGRSHSILGITDRLRQLLGENVI